MIRSCSLKSYLFLRWGRLTADHVSRWTIRSTYRRGHCSLTYSGTFQTFWSGMAIQYQTLLSVTTSADSWSYVRSESCDQSKWQADLRVGSCKSYLPLNCSIDFRGQNSIGLDLSLDFHFRHEQSLFYPKHWSAAEEPSCTIFASWKSQSLSKDLWVFQAILTSSEFAPTPMLLLVAAPSRYPTWTFFEGQHLKLSSNLRLSWWLCLGSLA